MPVVRFHAAPIVFPARDRVFDGDAVPGKIGDADTVVEETGTLLQLLMIIFLETLNKSNPLPRAWFHYHAHTIQCKTHCNQIIPIYGIYYFN